MIYINTRFQNKYLDKDVKRMVEKGYMDTGLALTSDGIRFLCEYVYEVNKKDISKLLNDQDLNKPY